MLNHKPDGSCVFLSDAGALPHSRALRLRNQAAAVPAVPLRAGADRRPLERRPALRLPVGGGEQGPAAPRARADLAAFAAQLAEREGLAPRPDGSLVPPPRLHGGQRLDWPDMLRIVQTLVAMLRDPYDPMERRCASAWRWPRKCAGPSSTALRERG